MTAALILILIFFKIDIQTFLAALTGANLFFYLPLITTFVVIWLFGEAQNLHALFRYFGHSLSYRNALAIRGLTYLLMVVNYNLGVGGIAVYLNRRHAIALPRTATLMLFYMFLETFVLAVLSLAGTILSPEDFILLGQVRNICLLIIMVSLAILLLARGLPDKGRLGKIKQIEFMKVFHQISFSDFALLCFWRGLYFLSFIIFFYFGFRTFDLAVPFLTLAAYIPLIFFIGNLPITPAGIGTIQAAMLFFFRDYAQPSQIMAFSVTYSCSLIFLRLPLGLIFLKKDGHYLTTVSRANPSE